ncbi:MAG: hypothetical protein FJ245_01550 [Nitrospira sp.]|nr:hypothetical protein [Nitrospira sp.]
MRQPSPDKLNRSFGLVMAGGLAGLALLRYVLVGTVAWWLVGLSGAFCAAGLLAPRTLTPLRAGWMKLALLLGFINQRILLTILFGLLITPTALLLRLLGKQPIQLRAEGADSYWRMRRADEFTASRMERQF